MELFRMDNTEGYTHAQLDALNAEWEARAEADGLEDGSEEYTEQAKAFSDEVAGR